MLANIQKEQVFAAGIIALLVTSLSFVFPASIAYLMDTKNAAGPEIICAAMFITIVLIIVFAGLNIYMYSGKKEQTQSLFNSII